MDTDEFRRDFTVTLEQTIERKTFAKLMAFVEYANNIGLVYINRLNPDDAYRIALEFFKPKTPNPSLNDSDGIALTEDSASRREE